MERRLAAILAADVVGYSRLMEADESGTLERLKSLRKELVQPKITERGGRIVKLMGDGLLAEFPSVVEAVQCAVDIQQAMAGREADLPDERRIRLRIGINLGDIIVEGDDIYGDGVNVAARLEGLASPDGICVSGTVFDHVKSKVGLDFADLGEQQVKNIDQPVQVYRIVLDGEADASEAAEIVAGRAAVLELPDKPSIAVLPFTNMSGDPEQEYFSDGITEDIITELSRFRSLFVIARNSSFHYKGRSPKVQDVGRELGVRYVPEGSVRRAGNRMRITAQLVEATTGNHVWSDRYDRDKQDLFAVQDEVTQAIAATIEGRMASTGAQRSRRKPTDDLVAYDYFLQGRENSEHRGDPDAAAQLLRRAIELDPGFAQAHTWLSWLYIHLFNVDLRSEMLREALILARKAVSLDETDAWSHAIVGLACLFGRQHDLAGHHIDRAVALNSVDIRIASVRGMWLAFTGRGDEAAKSLDVALRRDPFPPVMVWDTLNVALFQARRYEKTIQVLNRLPRLARWNHYYLAASYAHLDQIERARASGAEIQQLLPGFSLGQVGLTETFKDQADMDHLLEGLRKAGLPE